MAPSSLASAFTGKTIDLPSAGRELNVRYIAEGEIRHEGEKLFVTVRLTDTKTRKQACKAAAIAANEGRGEIPPGMGRTPLRYRDDLGFQWEDLAGIAKCSANTASSAAPISSSRTIATTGSSRFPGP